MFRSNGGALQQSLEQIKHQSINTKKYINNEIITIYFLKATLEQIKTEISNFSLNRKKLIFKYCIEELWMKDYIYEKLSNKQRVYYEV